MYNGYVTIMGYLAGVTVSNDNCVTELDHMAKTRCDNMLQLSHQVAKIFPQDTLWCLSTEEQGAPTVLVGVKLESR